MSYGPLALIPEYMIPQPTVHACNTFFKAPNEVGPQT